MTAQQKIAKILEIIDLEINDFAIECKIIPNSLKAAIKRDALTDDIVKKIHDRFGVRKGFFKDGKEPVMDPNITSVQNQSDNKELPLGVDLGDAIRRVVEDSTEYLVIPKVVLEGKYRLVPIEQIEKDQKALDESSKQIQGLQEIIREITNRPINIQLPKVENT